MHSRNYDKYPDVSYDNFIPQVKARWVGYKPRKKWASNFIQTWRVTDDGRRASWPVSGARPRDIWNYSIDRKAKYPTELPIGDRLTGNPALYSESTLTVN